MVSKRTLPSSPSDPPESQINPKKRKTTSVLLPRLVTPTSEDEDERIVRLLVEEDAWCVGSCDGWLVLLDNEDATPFIVSAFSGSARFYLPPLETLPFPPQVEKSYFMQALRKSFITKAVVVGHPDTRESFAAVVLYTDSIYCNLAYCKNRDGDLSWEALPSEGGLLSYNEIMVHGRALHTLTMDLAVHTWDLSGPQPVMTRQVHPSIPRAIWEADYKLSFNKFYLAESSSGEVLLVVRRVGYYVNGDGVAVEEYDLLTDEDTHPLVCPYQTLKFDAYKVDFEEDKWVQVEDLGDMALFVGCNNSLSLSAGELAGYEGNMIYFTDDNWEQMNEDYLYGGHDLGKFNLQLGRVEPIDNAIEDDRIVPPPFWIVPAH